MSNQWCSRSNCVFNESYSLFFEKRKWIYHILCFLQYSFSIVTSQEALSEQTYYRSLGIRIPFVRAIDEYSTPINIIKDWNGYVLW